MDREPETAPVVPHTPEQEDEQLRRYWRRGDAGNPGSGSTPPEGYAEESDAGGEGAGWGPL